MVVESVCVSQHICAYVAVGTVMPAYFSSLASAGHMLQGRPVGNHFHCWRHRFWRALSTACLMGGMVSEDDWHLADRTWPRPRPARCFVFGKLFEWDVCLAKLAVFGSLVADSCVFFELFRSVLDFAESAGLLFMVRILSELASTWCCSVSRMSMKALH